jgi:hypothetical protein
MSNVTVDGVSWTWPGRPVPLTPIVRGLPAALAAIETAAVRGPVLVGAKVTPIRQHAPGATALLQSFVWLKSVAWLPVMATLEINSAPEPVFDNAIV